jgi:hypothetical protein
VDPDDVMRKSRVVLEKKGFAAAAVGRAMAATMPSAEDAAESFNEQKRRRTAAGHDWLVAHADLWELPKEIMEEVKAERLKKRGGGDGGGGGEGAAAEASAAAPDDAAADDGPELSERAQKLVAKGLLPIAEQHVIRPGDEAKNDKTKHDGGSSAAAAGSAAAGGFGAAGTGAQDRQRTGKSLRLQRLEKAERLAFDLCPHLAAARECPHGDRCKRMHDVEGYMRAKPGDIPGPCPCGGGGGGDACPFGMRCRFFGAHAAGGDKALPKKPTPASPTDPIAVAHPEVWTRGEVTGAGASPTGGGSVGVGVSAETNIFTDALQRDLAKNDYPMPRSDALLRRMMVPVKCLSYAQVDSQKKKAKRLQQEDAEWVQPRIPVARAGSLGSREPGGREPRNGPAPVDFRGQLYVVGLYTLNAVDS